MSRLSPAILCLLLLAACATPKDLSSEDQQKLGQAEQMRKSGNADQAVQLLSEVVAKNPDNPASVTQLGYALIAAGKPQDAVDVFDHLISLLEADTEPNAVLQQAAADYARRLAEGSLQSC